MFVNSIHEWHTKFVRITDYFVKEKYKILLGHYTLVRTIYKLFFYKKQFFRYARFIIIEYQLRVDLRNNPAFILTLFIKSCQTLSQ